MRELIATAMRKIRPEVHVTFADGPGEALRAAVELAAGGPVLFLYEKLDPALEALESLGATPWPEEDLMGDLEGAAPPDDLPSDLIISGNHVQAATTNTPIGPA
jgi:cyanophycin synthetase